MRPFESGLCICERRIDDLDCIGVVSAPRFAAVAQRWTEIVRIGNAVIHFHGAFGDVCVQHETSTRSFQIKDTAIDLTHCDGKCAVRGAAFQRMYAAL